MIFLFNLVTFRFMLIFRVVYLSAISSNLPSTLSFGWLNEFDQNLGATGQITIIPKPETRAFPGIPLLSHILGWPRRFGRYNFPKVFPTPFVIECRKYDWLVVSTHLKNISQNGNLPQIRVKIKNVWNLQLDEKWQLGNPGNKNNTTQTQYTMTSLGATQFYEFVTLFLVWRISGTLR